jgi:serpin B
MNSLSRRHFLAAASAAAVTAALRNRLAACIPVPDPAEGVVAAANTAFGLDLYGRLRAEPGNAFFSPFSVSAALAMTAAGARGTTLDEMVKVLRLSADPAKADAGFKNLLITLTTVPEDVRGGGHELSIANAVWGQKGYPWRKEFLDRIGDSYGAGLHQADFAADPEAGRRAVNRWVETQTRQKIKDLLAEGLVTRDTRMVLANAVYFKGTWDEAFDKKRTQDGPFTTAGGKKKSVPLMHRTGDYRYHGDADLQALELPYRGGRTSMVVLLPRKPDGVAALEKRLTADALAGWLGKLKPTENVRVTLPRFTAATAFRLDDPLKALGMTAAFGDADFGGMHAGREPLGLSAVVHKAYVDVNEEGTEAAAATGAVISKLSLPAEPTEFRADRPFLFLIRHPGTETVLFLGRVADPTV